ncbi:MAG: hypothetical protein Q8L10_01730 [Candidatus Moranbacteria bacterium]|nr:hypothetical protein [Candidatus Moranbacteria bacterium]
MKKILVMAAMVAAVASAPIMARATIVDGEFAEELITGQSADHEEDGGCGGGGGGKGGGKGGGCGQGGCGGGGQGGGGGHHEEPPTPTPVPPALLLFGSGLAGLVAARKRKK